MKNQIIFILFILLASASYGQLGYLGKRTGIEVGVGTNQGVVGSLLTFNKYTEDNDVLLPKLSVGVLRETKRGAVLHLVGTYHQLPNSHISSYQVEEGIDVVFKQIDTIWTQSNNLQFALGMRKYRELAPLGLYFEFQCKANFISNKSLYRSEDIDEYTSLNYFDKRVDFETVERSSIIPEFGMSVGTTIPLNRVFAIDVGASVNFSFGRYTGKFGDITLMKNADSIHKILCSKKIFQTNLLELYAKIILFP